MNIKPLKTFNVVPRLPESLTGLLELAYNLRWSWDLETRALFRRIDRGLWETTGRNPVAMLGCVDQERLDELAQDSGFLANFQRVATGLRDYMAETESAYARSRQENNGLLIAYFSLEFAITDCIPVYSGGLGVLAGDHLKAASDFGLPLVAVGLLYQYGYFRQRLNSDGWQQEVLTSNDFYTMPIRPVLDRGGQPLVIRVSVGDHEVLVKIWIAEVGRISLYLLDTNLEQNQPTDRQICDQLYTGERELRLRQEIVLGVGGMLALDALGHAPNVFHMNEGHTALLALERLRRLVQGQGLSVAEAVEVTRSGNVFTTHTPVAAGNEYFAPELMDRYFHSWYGVLRITREQFLAFGRVRPTDPAEAFCMTVLALRLSTYSNAVSQLHQTVTREMWQTLWPDAPCRELPIGHVTNAVHAASWMSDELRLLLDSYWGPDWHTGYHRHGSSANHNQPVPLEELWRTHERRRERLVVFARERLRRQLMQRRVTQAEIAVADHVLDPRVLTIGFARRFTAYKRPYLLLKNPERLRQLVNHPQRPVQFIFGGKAHPLDETGKNMIRDLVHLCRQADFRRSLVFIEDYDLDVARFLVQGVDVWLNTPRRPLEASGTSGMKAAMNGALNLSVLDGWWDEAYRADIGWAIGSDQVLKDETQQDQMDADELFDLLEKQVAPLFYDCEGERFPTRWAARMRQALEALCPEFHAHRMVAQYAADFYLPARARAGHASASGYAAARSLAAWKSRCVASWTQVAIDQLEVNAPQPVGVGMPLEVVAKVRLGGLSPDEVAVQFCLGRVDPAGNLVDPVVTEMAPVGQADGGWVFKTTTVPCCVSGQHGYTLRVLPHHADLYSPWELGVVRWMA